MKDGHTVLILAEVGAGLILAFFAWTYIQPYLSSVGVQPAA